MVPHSPKMVISLTLLIFFSKPFPAASKIIYENFQQLKKNIHRNKKIKIKYIKNKILKN